MEINYVILAGSQTAKDINRRNIRALVIPWNIIVTNSAVHEIWLTLRDYYETIEQIE